ncbi:MAG: GntR family transcriptional regulator [Ruminococcaceae bacterium]|nr:GntR family transcriptional regulator [Oscillospiraceae bacterium]
MISFESFIIEGDSPIYMQILRHIKMGVVAGTVVDGDELPSRRVLSALLGVNPNTVQKAYRLLEEEGLIQSHTGTKSYMLLDKEKVSEIRVQLVEAQARDAVESLKRMGISMDEAVDLLERFWDRGDTV